MNKAAMASRTGHNKTRALKRADSILRSDGWEPTRHAASVTVTLKFGRKRSIADMARFSVRTETVAIDP